MNKRCKIFCLVEKRSKISKFVTSPRPTWPKDFYDTEMGPPACSKIKAVMPIYNLRLLLIVNRNQALDWYLFTIMRFWQTPRLLGHVDTKLPEFVFETSFKIVPSNPSSEVAPCFELEPVYEVSWRHGWWYIDFDIVLYQSKSKKTGRKSAHVNNSYHP